tara:strand:- start:4702 stop:5529 length:828 start_codon:yes stop_codon:yes gene_type:complete
MPYTTDERNELDFYKSFVSELRKNHIDKIKESIPKNFRDDNRVLQSFEDIVTGLGLEDANLEDGGSVYETALFNPNIEGTTQNKSTFFDSVRSSTVTTQTEKLKQYTKSELLNKTIERGFSELITTPTSTLPSPIPEEVDDDGNVVIEGAEVKEGDIVVEFVPEQEEQSISDILRQLRGGDTTGIKRKIWLIQNGKKRRFISTNDFYSSKYYRRPLKQLPKDFLDSIDDGKLIVLETLAPFNSPTTVIPPVVELEDINVVSEPYSDGDDDGYGGS